MTTTAGLDPARIAAAAGIIDPAFQHSPQFHDPQLDATLDRSVLVKVETVNPIGSFKGRGADLLVRRFTPGQRVCCLSSGNFGQAVAYAGRRHGLAVRVFVAADVNPVKRARIEALGAAVTVVDGGETEAVHAIRAHLSAHPDDVFIDGTEPEIAEGAGTIGLELLAADFDTVVLPVGSGALASGVACWLKAHAPQVRVVGVGAEGAAATVLSWRAGRTVAGPAVTVAEGIAVERPAPALVERLRLLVDDMVLVDEAAILDATALAVRTLNLLLEPTGAVGLAAIASQDIPGDRLATVLTGAAPRPGLLGELLRGR